MTAKPKILVVDDEPGPRESLKIILKQEFEVTATERGSDALELLRHKAFDIVLLDLTMPNDLSGIATLRGIRDSGADVAAIVITGQGALESAVECLRLGASDYLNKPYRADEVLSAVRTALATRTARQEAARIKESILGNLSHEFRTPLNAILGYSTILGEEVGAWLSEDQKGALVRIQLNSQRLLSYLEGLLFLTQLDTGDLPLLPKEFAVRPWLERLIAPIRREAAENRVSIAINCDEHCVGYSNPETLSRLMGVLIYEATSACYGDTITVSAQHESGGGLRFSIQHQGTGGLGAAPVGLGPRDPELAGSAPASDRLAFEVVSRAARVLRASVENRFVDDRQVEIRLTVPPPNDTSVEPPVRGLRSDATTPAPARM